MRVLLAAIGAPLLLALASGCAASSPVLVEPRIVPGGDVRLQLGAAVLAPIAGDTEALTRARSTLATPPEPDPLTGSRDAAVRAVDPGAAVALGARPGVAPIVRTTVGLGDRVEGHLRYGGRDVAGGARFIVFEKRTQEAGALTFSIGGEGRFVLRHRPEDGVLSGVATDNVQGVGGAVPAVLAWQSDAGLIIAYVAATIGYERITGRIAMPALMDPAPYRDAKLSRLFGAGTLGLGVGFRRVRVIAELGIQRDWLDATIGGASTQVRLVSLAPAFAFGLTF